MVYQIPKANILRKAKRLVESNCIAEVVMGVYQVSSSTQKDRFYVIENYACECVGFKIHGFCSHSEAVRIFEKKRDEQ